MRHSALVSLLAAVVLLLSERSGTGLPDCAECKCHIVQAWRQRNYTNAEGLRKQHATDPKLTVPILSAPASISHEQAVGPFYTHALCQNKDRVDSGVTQKHVAYTAAGAVTCNVPSTLYMYRVQVTLTATELENFNNPQDQNQFTCPPIDDPN